jgi:Fe-Mn family superoxide dismutase
MYTPKTFTLPALKGISQKNIEEHLKLYEGYVNNTNKILKLLEDPNIDPYAKSETQRRFSFEFNGMKNHEYYFTSLEGGTIELTADTSLRTAIEAQWGSFDAWLANFKTLAKTRGIGWAILYYDADEQKLHNVWIDEQHLGHLNSCQYIIGIDMWEHAYVADYQPSGKAQYIDDYFANVNWEKVAEIFEEKGLK